MKFRCLFGHDWIFGRFASVDARRNTDAITRNRICARCGKCDMAADRLEAELRRRAALREEMNGE